MKEQKRKSIHVTYVKQSINYLQSHVVWLQNEKLKTDMWALNSLASQIISHFFSHVKRENDTANSLGKRSFKSGVKCKDGALS